MKPMALITAAGAGAVIGFFLDPRTGRRRRALVRDRVMHLAHATRDAVGTRSRDVGSRARGLVIRLQPRFAQGPVTDDALQTRVRSRMGSAVRGSEFGWRRTNWSPTARLLVGIAGGALVLAGLARRDVLVATLAIPGAALVVRAVTDRELQRLVGEEAAECS